MTLESTAELERRLDLALAILRITLGVFFLLWAVEKLVMPEVNAAIWEKFFNIPLAVNLSYPIGIVNGLMALALIAGFLRTFTYGYWLVFHSISVISTGNYLVKPFGSPNHLFLAGVPVVAAAVALFVLREYDSWSMDGKRAARATSGP
jgi:hypothetical protein